MQGRTGDLDLALRQIESFRGVRCLSVSRDSDTVDGVDQRRFRRT